MEFTATILGCGGSMGVPVLGGEPGGSWGECDPAEPKNRRSRPALLIQGGGRTLLVDAGPDCRAQLLAAGVTKLDGVLFTHAHADHTQGIDDLRSLTMASRAPIPMFADAATTSEIEGRFAYMFGRGRVEGYYDKPLLAPHPPEALAALFGWPLAIFEQDHFVCATLGLRLGPFAYSTDVKALSDAAFAALAGVETWIVACVRSEPHVAHAHLPLVLDWVERLGPKRAVLTHMNHTLDYGRLRRILPAGVEPGYDGMELNFAA